jgi:hypothetical protein
MTQEERLSRYQQFKDFQKVIHLMRGAQFLGNPIGLKKLLVPCPDFKAGIPDSNYWLENAVD